MESSKASNRNIFLILISYLAFISLGLPDGLLGISWPYISERHHVPLDYLGVLLISFVLGYLSTSTTSGKILTKISLGLLLGISCCITGLSLLGFAFSGYWSLIILASFFLGSGGGAIDTSINVFAASRFSPSVVNWLHGFYGIGATAGPFLITWMLVNQKQWYYGYLAVGIVQITLSLIFIFTINYWKVSIAKEEESTSGTYREAFATPMIWINLLIFFVYAGLEIGVGQWIFTLLTKSRNLNETDAGLWTGAYWGSFTAGRIVFGFILTRVSVHKVLKVAFTGILLGTSLVALNLGPIWSLVGILLIGISNAPVFPCLISNTPKHVGVKQAANVIGFQISVAMIGGALLPGFEGLLSDYFGLEVIAFIFFLEAVLLLIFYWIVALKLRRAENVIGNHEVIE